MTLDSNQKTYFATIDDSDEEKMISETLDSTEKVFLWEEGQGEDQLQSFVIKEYDPHSKEITLQFSGKMLERLTGPNFTGKKVYLKINYNKLQYFNYGLLRLNKETKLYIFSPKQAFYKGLKRGNYRLPASANLRIQVKLGENVFDCQDISAGGLSIMLDESESYPLSKGDCFKNSTVRLNKQDFTISEIEVKGLFTKKDRPNIAKGKTQFGLAFTHLSKSVEEALFLEINSEARSNEMRKKFSKKA